MEYTCPHCSAPIDVNAHKCDYCGHVISDNEFKTNSIEIGNKNVITNTIIGNNNNVSIGTDWYNEDNWWFNRLCAGVMRIVVVWIFAYILYCIGLVL